MSFKPHSITVPTQYRRMKIALKSATERKQSIKSFIYSEKHARICSMKATLLNYSENRLTIEAAIKKSKILEENPRLCPFLCKILVTELIFRGKQLIGNSKPVQTVRAYKNRLQTVSNCDATVVKNERKQDVKPRYVRINTHLFSIEKAKAALQKQGWQFKKHPVFDNYQNFLKEVGTLSEDEYMMDMHVDNLFIFHPKTKNYWALHKYVKTRQFLLQDKGTCLVGELLRPPFDATVLDMCAAPGMKTIHLSNIMQNRGKIYAVEQNKQRYELLSKLVREAGCKNVETMLADVLSVSCEQCPDVDYILVDPSCSGSGIQSRISIDAEEKDPKRLHKLAGLQIKILSHAMAAFPKAKRIIYSTCSEYKEENEAVVQRCLQINRNYKLLSCRKEIRNKWHTSNANFSDINRRCLFCRTADDYTDGIFIALFQKCK